MKKKLFGLMLLVLLTMLVAVGTAQAAPPETATRYCTTCLTDTTVTLVSITSWNNQIHGPNYRCNDCGVVRTWSIYNEDHTFTSATCTRGEYCTVCGGVIGKEKPLGHDTSGAAATCTTDQVCAREGCNEVITPATGHSWGEWVQSGTQYAKVHTRTCQNTGCTESESSSCSGGTATCLSPAICDTCGGTWGGLGSHVLGDYYQHPVYNLCHAQDCTVTGCDYVGYGNHTGDNSLCTEQQTCTTPGCGLPWVNGHDWDWGNATANNNSTCYSDGTQTIPCTRCKEGSMTIYNPNDPYKKNHEFVNYVSDNNATCTANATETAKCKWYNGIARECNATDTKEIPNSALGHTEVTDEAVAPTCTATGLTEGSHCDVCGTVLVAQEVVPANGHTEVIDKAVAPTCTTTGLTEGKHCSVCKAVLVKQNVIPANGHSYEAVITDPTCTEGGFTTHTCAVCGDTYTDSFIKAREHWYDLWTPNGDGTHSASCKRGGCTYVATTACTLYEVTAADAVLTVCPVCGEYGSAVFAVISNAAMTAVEKSLPYGETLLRAMDAPFDGALYAFTAICETGGKVAEFNGAVSVTLPLDTEKYPQFKLVRVDASSWTELAFTCADSMLTFETDVAGLFLLLPVN